MSGKKLAVLCGINSKGVPVPSCFDTVTGNSCMTDSEQHAINSGKRFMCQDYDSDVDIAAPKYWHIKTPDTATRCHLTFVLRASGPGVLEMLEAPTTSADGTALTAYNKDRNCATAATMGVYKDPTVSADGSVRTSVNVIGSMVGATPLGGSGGNCEKENKDILGQNAQILIKFTPFVDDTHVSCCFEWTEEA